ncbi:GFA family protein [Marinimicrobium sp. UBA4509]
MEILIIRALQVVGIVWRSICVLHLQVIQGNPMNKHKGSCLCGAVRFEVQGGFDSFYLCHCKHCQKDTGSAHAANLFSLSASLTWLSGSDSVTTFRLQGTRHSKSFCQLCGSALPISDGTGLLVVPAGCLDTEVSIQPTAHIFTSSKAVWDRELEVLPTFESLPG